MENPLINTKSLLTYTKKILVYVSVLLLVLISGLPMVTEAASASLFLSPAAGTYTVGDNFSVAVKVDTGGTAINAAEVSLSFAFDLDDFEVVSISKANSIFTVWTQDPVFSNSVGTINFGGGVPSPGFTGASGTILTIIFKVKTAGTATLNFTSGAILANDGKGTNILANMVGGNYTFQPKAITPPVEKPPVEKPKPTPTPIPAVPPAAPVIYSSTHPDLEKWYSNNNLSLNWSLPSDIDGVSLLFDQKPTSLPDSISEGKINSKSYKDIQDGTWYFHIKFQNQYGWGKILHRKVLIDITPPEPFEIKIERGNETDPQPILHFQTIDETSGIEYYEVQIGEGETFPVSLDKIKGNPFKMPSQAPGKHSIEVKAFDRAGNFASAATELEVLPIEAPKITKIPKSIRIGDTLTVVGEAPAEIFVRIFIQKAEKEPMMEKVKADLAGNFVFSYDKPLAKGDYVLFAQAEDERGALSYLTKKYSLEVGLPPFLRIGKIAVDYLTTMITLIVLIVGILVIIFYSWYRISLWRKRVRKETTEAEESVRKSFRSLRQEIQEQIELLDKKPGLTPKEKEIRDKLQKALDTSEEFISKEMKDIEKELE